MEKVIQKDSRQRSAPKQRFKISKNTGYQSLLYAIFQIGNRNLVFDGRSYAIIDTELKGTEALRRFARHTAQRKQNGYRQLIHVRHTDKLSEEVNKLIDAKILSTDDDQYPSAPSFKRLILLLTNSCNLRCRYCFEHDYRTKYGTLVMSRQVAEKSVDYLFKHSPSKHVLIHFYGGEPLLNWSVLKHTVKYGKSQAQRYGKQLGFLLVTNGTLLTNTIASFIKKNNIAVQISLDGTKKTHDSNRIYPNGKGSYDGSFHGLARLKTQGIHCSVLSVVSRQFTDSMPRIEDLNKISSGRFALAVNANFHTHRTSVTNTGMKFFIREYKKYMESQIELCNTPEDLTLTIRKILDQMKYGARNYHGCGGGLEEITIAPDGTIYLCERMSGKTNYSILDNPNPEDVWHRYITDITNAKCSGCWAKYLCGGGCAHTIQTYTNNKGIPPWWLCEMKKIEIEAAVRASYKFSLIKGG